MMRRALAIAVILFTASAARAYRSDAGPSRLFTMAHRVVIAKVVSIERIDGRRWARLAVSRDLKGPAGLRELVVLAQPTWTCDTSDAKLGEEALWFLVDARDPKTFWGFERPAIEKLPASSYLIANSGEGRLPIETPLPMKP